MSKRLTQLLTVAAALAVTGIAGAGTPRGAAPSTIVKFGDLSLDTKAGVAKLHSRLHAAAELVCSGIDSRVLGLRDRYDTCVADAVAQSVATVGNTNLSNYHRFGRKAELLASN
jgi:UrcA family protein